MSGETGPAPCYCGGVMDDDHYCDYGDPFGGWCSTPVRYVPFVLVPADAEDYW